MQGGPERQSSQLFGTVCSPARNMSAPAYNHAIVIKGVRRVNTSYHPSCCYRGRLPTGCPEGKAGRVLWSIHSARSVTSATVSCRKLVPTVARMPVVKPSNCERACQHTVSVSGQGGVVCCRALLSGSSAAAQAEQSCQQSVQR